MIRFVKETEQVKWGLNIYHPSEWRTSIGFKFRHKSSLFMVRYNLKQNRFYKVRFELDRFELDPNA